MYQFGVLGIIFVFATTTLTVVIIALLKGNPGAIAGLLIAGFLIYWFGGIRSPAGLGGRIYLLLRNGVPLAPRNFRSNATLGYWLGIPMIYVGHLITIPTLYFAWELSKQPIAGIPIGIPLGFGLMFYSSGVGLVESSYNLWARELDGAIPGDPGSSPLKPLLVLMGVATLALVVSYPIFERSKPTPARHLPAAAQDDSSGFSSQRATAKLADFLPVTYPGWVGHINIREDTSGPWARFPATMTGALSGGETFNLVVDVADESDSSIEFSFTLNDAGDRLNQLAIIERSELTNDRIAVAAYGKDAQETGNIRLRFLMGETAFSLEVHKDIGKGQFALLENYSFARDGSVN